MMRVVKSCATKSASRYGPNYSHLCVTFVKDLRILLLFSIITSLRAVDCDSVFCSFCSFMLGITIC